MAPPRPSLPEHLAIVFPIDKYDAWAYLSQGHLYLPSTATTKTGVKAIGLTGNLKNTGPLGNFWEDLSGLLVMPGRGVQRLNSLSPIYYDNVDALVSDNFRALRRIVNQPYVSYVSTYVSEALLRVAAPKVAAASDTKNVMLELGDAFIQKMSKMTGREAKYFYKTLYDAFTATAAPFNTFTELTAQLNRFAPRGAEMLISMLPQKADTDVVVSTIKLGELKSAAVELRTRVPAEATKRLRELLAEEGDVFSGEIEWLANPTPDRRTGGLSVFLNVPPNSILYLIGRSIFDVEEKIVPMSLRGMWVVGVPSDNADFESYNQAMLDALYDYENGITDITKLRAVVAKIEKKYKLTVLEPNPYWLVRR